MIEATINPVEQPVRERPVAFVLTTMRFGASAERVWQGLMFYEQLGGRPPLHLRLLLPVPLGTQGKKEHVGDEVRCLYEGGHLIKRITEIEPLRRYAFEITEQELAVRGGVKLRGGEYRLREIQPGRSEITVTTRFVSRRWPRWLWRPIEAAVCHAFHRYILQAMRRAVEGSPQRVA
jgi:hypothetical protein